MQKQLPLQQPQLKAMIYFIIFTTSSPYTRPRDEPQSQRMWMVPISSTWFTVPLSPVVRFEYRSPIRTSSTLVPNGYFSRSTVTRFIVFMTNISVTIFLCVCLTKRKKFSFLSGRIFPHRLTKKKSKKSPITKPLLPTLTSIIQKTFQATVALLGENFLKILLRFC